MLLRGLGTIPSLAYPYVRRDDHHTVLGTLYPRGVSPHLRGRFETSQVSRYWLGYIPVHTGTITTLSPAHSVREVYPRTYEDNVFGVSKGSGSKGISPYIQG